MRSSRILRLLKYPAQNKRPKRFRWGKKKRKKNVNYCVVNPLMSCAIKLVARADESEKRQIKFYFQHMDEESSSSYVQDKYSEMFNQYKSCQKNLFENGVTHTRQQLYKKQKPSNISPICLFVCVISSSSRRDADWDITLFCVSSTMADFHDNVIGLEQLYVLPQINYSSELWMPDVILLESPEPVWISCKCFKCQSKHLSRDKGDKECRILTNTEKTENRPLWLNCSSKRIARGLCAIPLRPNPKFWSTCFHF